MELGLLKQLNEARRARRAAIVVTDLVTGEQALVEEGGMGEHLLTDALRAALHSGESRVIESDEGRFFLNVHVPPARLVVIGAVHISQALAAMAPTAGLDMRVIDPRTAFATPERFPGVPLQAEWPQDALAKTPLDGYTALAALTHDPKIDDPALEAALEAGCFYVGALGSRKTHGKRIERFTAAGMSPTTLERIHAPIGLDIGARSPAEIAVAILAEVIASLRRRGLEGAADRAAA